VDGGERSLDLDALADHASLLLARACAGRPAQIAIGTAAAGKRTAACDILNDEAQAVEGIELEIVEQLIKGRRGNIEAVAAIFRAKLERIHFLGSETKLGNADGARRHAGAIEIEAASLVPL